MHSRCPLPSCTELTIHTEHCAVHTMLKCTLHSALHCTEYYTLHRAQHNAHCTEQCTPHSTQYMHSCWLQCTVHNAQLLAGGAPPSQTLTTSTNCKACIHPSHLIFILNHYNNYNFNQCIVLDISEVWNPLICI